MLEFSAKLRSGDHWPPLFCLLYCHKLKFNLYYCYSKKEKGDKYEIA